MISAGISYAAGPAYAAAPAYVDPGYAAPTYAAPAYAAQPMVQYATPVDPPLTSVYGEPPLMVAAPPCQRAAVHYIGPVSAEPRPQVIYGQAPPCGDARPAPAPAYYAAPAPAYYPAPVQYAPPAVYAAPAAYPQRPARGLRPVRVRAAY